MRPLRYVVIHHSATDDGTLLDVLSIRRYHVEVRRWRDIGYHFVVERVMGEPVVTVGRPLNLIGAHAPGRNHDSIGVCVAGNWTSEAPGEDLVEKTVELVADLLEVHGMPSSNVIAHRDVRATLCPGKVPVDFIAREAGRRVHR